MLNDYYQNIGMKGFIQRYGIVNAVKRGAFMFIKLHLVKDYEVRKVLWQERASTKIKPYLKYKETDVEGLSFPENDVENPIWIYWNKGIEQAPIIVQKCYESVCKHSNQKIILLNDQNLADYIRLPDYIEKKKDAGQIPMAGYADLMRFALLEHYGGTWIDSTVYLTDTGYLFEIDLNSVNQVFFDKETKRVEFLALGKGNHYADIATGRIDKQWDLKQGYKCILYDYYEPSIVKSLSEKGIPIIDEQLNDFSILDNKI